MPRPEVVPPSPASLGSCARAATAAESRFRVDTPLAPARGVRVIALDRGAAAVAERVATEPWTSASFFTCEGDAEAVALSGIGGVPADLDAQLADADVVVMIATEDAGAGCAHFVGRACWQRGIMTAGLVLADGFEADQAVAALRPHARVLLPTADATDVVELLTALRA